jgi:hypothetical protein
MIEREHSAANALLSSGSLELLLDLIGCLNIEGRSYEYLKTRLGQASRICEGTAHLE